VVAVSLKKELADKICQFVTRIDVLGVNQASRYSLSPGRINFFIAINQYLEETAAVLARQSLLF
jgi:hypothetical protein